MPSDNYIIPLTKAYDNKPRTKRANYSMKMIFDFLYKHTRKNKKDIVITEEVNNFIWKNSIQNPPRKIAVTLKKKDNKYYVFLKDSENSKKFAAEQKELKKVKENAKKSKLEKGAVKDKQEKVGDLPSKEKEEKTQPTKEGKVGDLPSKEKEEKTQPTKEIKEKPVIKDSTKN